MIVIWENQVVEETILLEEIWRNSTKEQEVLKKLEKNERQTWEDNGIIYMKGRIYIPNNQKIWEQILWENHDSANIEHSGQQWMLELIKRNYWWPEIKGNVKKYV